MERRLVGLVIFVTKFNKEVDRTQGLFRAGHVEKAGEMREVVGHWALHV